MSTHKGKPFWSIRSKLFTVILAVTVVAFLSYLIFVRSYAQQASVARYEQQVVTLREQLANNIGFYVSTCVKAARSIYYNTSVLNLLENTNGNFINSETRDSKELFSYMLSVYAAVPSAKQIHLQAYRLQRSLLVTTDNLARYISSTSSQFETADSFNAHNRVDQTNWVESSHLMGNYGHFVASTADRNQYVFTVHVPIYRLPNSSSAIGLLSVDITTKYIDDNCGFSSDTSAMVYITNQDGKIVYASDRSLIEKPLRGNVANWEQWLASDMPSVGSYIQGGYLVTTQNFSSTDCPWKLYIVTPLRAIIRDALDVQNRLMLAFCLYLLAMVALLFIALMRYMRPLNQVAKFIHANYYRGKHNLKPRLADQIHYTVNDEVGVLVESIDAMLDTIDGFVVRQYQMLLANRTAELRTLQAQINPHFIYNTLQCVASKTLERGDAESYNYIASFGQLLHYAMNMDESTVPLEREADHMQRYLALQSMRYDCALVIMDIEVEKKLLKVQIPKMSLQPLAENSLHHGRLYELSEGRICLHAALEGQWLVIEVRNNGVPIAPEMARKQTEKAQRLRNDYEFLRQSTLPVESVETLLPVERAEYNLSGVHHGNHIGLSNVFMRFLLRFGPNCGFAIESNDMNGTTVRLTIPKDRLIFDETPMPEEGGEAR